MKKDKPTAKDVAKMTGLSTATVSMILNGKDSRFPKSTCQRVIDACNELGYVHSVRLHADTEENKVLVVIIPTYSNLYFVHAVEAMQHRAKELGYVLLTFDTCREKHQEVAIIQTCIRYPFAGVIFLYPPENNTLLQQLEWTKPVIHVYDKGLYSDADVLEFDGIRVGDIIGRHLIELGHKRIAFLSMDYETKQTVRSRRVEGLRKAYKESGFDPDESVLVCLPANELQGRKITPEGYELGYLLTKKLIERKENVTAIVGLNDMVALGAIDSILDAGLKVPEDYSVCGCDNTSVSKYRRISLTTVDSYPIKIGTEAVELLVKKIERTDFLSGVEDNPEGITRIEYFPKLIARKSTGQRKE